MKKYSVQNPNTDLQRWAAAYACWSGATCVNNEFEKLQAGGLKLYKQTNTVDDANEEFGQNSDAFIVQQ